MYSQVDRNHEVEIMKTAIEYYNHIDSSHSTCGESLRINVSSKQLNWDGLLVEIGHCHSFSSQDATTPNFYFGMTLNESYNMKTIIDDKSTTIFMEAGDVFVNPPCVPFTKTIDEYYEFLVLTVTPQALYGAYNGYLPINQLQFLQNCRLRDPVIENILNLFHIEVLKNGHNGELYIQNLLRLLSNYFIRNYSNLPSLESGQVPRSAISNDQMNTIVEYLEKNMSISVTVEELANLLDINKFHFLNEFKKHTNTTPHQFIISMKIDESKRLLVSTSDSIISIAHDLGFTDSSHFTRTFKKFCNQTPSQYRRTHLNEVSFE